MPQLAIGFRATEIVAAGWGQLHTPLAIPGATAQAIGIPDDSNERRVRLSNSYPRRSPYQPRKSHRVFSIRCVIRVRLFQAVADSG
jgi:hypothetical protein